MLLTDTAGLYTADPHRDSNAKLIERVDKIDAHIENLAGRSLSERGTGGMATKIEAAKLATASGVAVVIADGREKDVITRLANGEAIGTFFQPVASRLESRKCWLLSQVSKGKIYVDAGAAMALRRQNKSLLPAGITKVGGEFERGDVVNIFDSETGEKIACGISNYSSGDIIVIKGTRSDRIAGLLGREYGEEVVHRDNLVAL
jgi:glutamate 5-kinase